MEDEKRKERKLNLPGMCQFFMEKKRRYCSMESVRETQFCSHHQPQDAASSHPERVVCPLDPSHSVRTDFLERHLRRCPSLAQSKPAGDFVKLNANQPSPIEREEENDKSMKDVVDQLSPVFVSTVIQSLLSLFSDHPERKSGFLQSLAPVRALQTDQEAEAVVEGLKRDSIIDLENSKHGRRHHTQLIQLIKILLDWWKETSTTLPEGAQPQIPFDKSSCFAEYGAGRAEFLHIINQFLGRLSRREARRNGGEWDPSRGEPLFLAVDRDHPRRCFDRMFEDRRFHRIKCDIRDLDLLHAINSFQPEGHVATSNHLFLCSKHLCGPATDLTLQSLLNTLKSGEEKIGKDVIVMIALCCHHQCNWDQYVDQTFFREINMGKEEFSVLTMLTSWATCSFHQSADELKEKASSLMLSSAADVNSIIEPLFSQITATLSDPFAFSSNPDNWSPLSLIGKRLSVPQKELIGMMAKALIDEGRVRFLERLGFRTDRRAYCLLSTSLENKVLLARFQS